MEDTLAKSGIPGNLSSSPGKELDSETSIFVSNPVGGLANPILNPASRLTALDGKTVALYASRKANAFEFLARVAQRLIELFPTIKIISGVEGTVWAKPSYDREGDIDALVKERPDAVVMALSS